MYLTTALLVTDRTGGATADRGPAADADPLSRRTGHMILDSYHYDCTCSSSAARLTVNGGVSPVERVVEAYFRRFSALRCIPTEGMYLSESLILPQHTSPFGFPHRESAWRERQRGSPHSQSNAKRRRGRFYR